jgi:hypothetical protein
MIEQKYDLAGVEIAVNGRVENINHPDNFLNSIKTDITASDSLINHMYAYVCADGLRDVVKGNNDGFIESDEKFIECKDLIMKAIKTTWKEHNKNNKEVIDERLKKSLKDTMHILNLAIQIVEKDLDTGLRGKQPCKDGIETKGTKIDNRGINRSIKTNSDTKSVETHKGTTQKPKSIVAGNRRNTINSIPLSFTTSSEYTPDDEPCIIVKEINKVVFNSNHLIFRTKSNSESDTKSQLCLIMHTIAKYKATDEDGNIDIKMADEFYKLGMNTIGQLLVKGIKEVDSFMKHR